MKESQMRGDWSDPTSQRLVAEWLLLKTKLQLEAANSSPDGLARRVAEASERSALASTESAKHAKASVRWAIFAALVALATLLYSVLSK